jgi:serine/threonine protein kinase
MDVAADAQEQSRPPEAAARSQEIILQDTYRVVRQIGFGGMGVVYEAQHTRLPERFAVKVLLRSLMSDAEAFARFCREAQIMSQLHHPHVVQIVDFNLTVEQQPYFVMEYLEGRDLAAHLEAGEPMAPDSVVAIVDAVAMALHAAHHRGIIHGGVKPSNIFLCDVAGEEDPFVKVLDFGVARVHSGHSLVSGTNPMGTVADSLPGNLPYLTPEQVTGRIEEVGERTDQFALAAIAYEMLTGQAAFAADEAVGLLHNIVHEPPASLAGRVEWHSAAVEAVLLRALAKNPAQRFPSVTAFAGALAAAVRVAPVQVPAAVEHIYEDVPWAARDLEVTEMVDRIPRSPYRAVALGLVAAALAGVFVMKGWTRTLPDDAVVTFRSLMARVRHEPALPQPELPAPVGTPANVTDPR